MESTYLEHDEHFGSALSHFLFRVLHETHTCRACVRLDSLLEVCMTRKDSARPPYCCRRQAVDSTQNLTSGVRIVEAVK
jgi:hypothetical protein